MKTDTYYKLAAVRGDKVIRAWTRYTRVVLEFHQHSWKLHSLPLVYPSGQVPVMSPAVGCWAHLLGEQQILKECLSLRETTLQTPAISVSTLICFSFHEFPNSHFVTCTEFLAGRQAICSDSTSCSELHCSAMAVLKGCGH